MAAPIRVNEERFQLEARVSWIHRSLEKSWVVSGFSQSSEPLVQGL